MSEIKTKTTRQVIDEGLRTENWDLKGWYKTDEPAETADFEKPMWVSLDETNFRIAEKQVQIQKLADQITEFKKLALLIQDHCCTDCEDDTMCDFGCAITALKAALNSSKPTTQESQP